VETLLGVAPAERRVIGPFADIVARGCDALGWQHGPILRNAPGCDGSGFCDFGCRTDARQGTNLSYVPRALEAGAVLLTGLRADRVILEGERAVGLDAVSKGGRRMQIRAHGGVVLAGGGIPTPLFLLAQGLGNASGQVGRNLTLHPSAGLAALFDEPLRGYAYAPQGYYSGQFLKDGILIVGALPDLNVAPLIFGFAGRRLMDTMERIDDIASVGLLLADDTKGRVWRDVRGYPAISYQFSAKDMERAHQAMVHAGDMFLAAGATHIIPALTGGPILKRGSDFAQFRQSKIAAGETLWTSYHPLGTCKMGPDPATSVVDLDHQVHEVPGLYVVDGSTVPGPLGVNPQITIMGMANRAAELLADRLGAATGPRAAAGIS
jgi:choline dehydrogenase-like flavoprotein